jgi:hypothetical protein
LQHPHDFVEAISQLHQNEILASAMSSEYIRGRQISHDHRNTNGEIIHRTQFFLQNNFHIVEKNRKHNIFLAFSGGMCINKI